MPEAVITLKNKFPAISQEPNTPWLIVEAKDIKNACQFLKEGLNFQQLACITAIDYKDKFALVYNLYSYQTKEKIGLKVFLDKNNPSVESITPLWSGANWHEREAFDMMGINFAGHPDLKRILLPDGWVGHPLRKDYTNEGFTRMPSL